MTTAHDTLRDRIGHELARSRISSNTALIHRDHLEITESLEVRIARLEAAASATKNCAECAHRIEWATGAKS